MQRDPIKGLIEHVDLVVVRRGEKVTVDIPIHVEGEAADDTLVVVENSTISIEAEATHLPQQIVVSVEGLEAGSQITAAELELPTGSVLAVEDDLLIVNVTNAPVAEPEPETEAAEGEEAADGASAEAGEGESEES